MVEGGRLVLSRTRSCKDELLVDGGILGVPMNTHCSQ